MNGENRYWMVHVYGSPTDLEDGLNFWRDKGYHAFSVMMREIYTFVVVYEKVLGA